jgi:macrodomain Ter protein organizer (MatP/YcbG family)
MPGMGRRRRVVKMPVAEPEVVEQTPEVEPEVVEPEPTPVPAKARRGRKRVPQPEVVEPEPEPEVVEDEPTPEEEPTESKKPRQRVQYTAEDAEERFLKIQESIATLIKEKKPVPRSLKKELQEYHKVMNNVMKKKKRKNTNRRVNSESGFLKKKSISQEMANFLKVPADTKMSQTEISKAISSYIARRGNDADLDKRMNPDNRDLREPGELSLINPDEALTKLFNLDQYQKDVRAGKIKNNRGEIVRDDRFTNNVIPRLIQNHLS